MKYIHIITGKYMKIKYIHITHGVKNIKNTRHITEKYHKKEKLKLKK